MSTEPSGSKATILIVEDEVLIAADLETRLKGLGYTVCDKATSAEKALILIERHSPDLIMMDIVLKGEMDGIEAADVVRNKWGIPVVFLTAYTDTDRLDRAKLTYPFGYLLKPFQDRDIKITTEMALYVAKVDAERRKAEDALAESEKKYRLLTENANDMIYRMSIPGGIYEYVSPASERLFGYSPQEFYESPVLIRKIIHPDWIDYFEEQWENLIHGDIPPYYEYMITHRSGETRWMNQRNFLVTDDDRRPLAIEGIVTDITERRKAEAALLESEKRFQALSEGSFESIFFSEKGVCLDQNKTAEWMFGYTREEAIGRPGTGWIAPEDREAVKRNMQLDFARPYQITALRKDGTTFPAEIQARNFTYENRRIRVTALRDITDRKQAENELHEREQLFRDVFEQAAVGMSILTPEGVWLQVNQRLSDILGYSREELLHINYRDITTADSVEEDVARVRQMVEGKRNADSWEKRYIRKDGRVIWVRITTNLAHDRDGRPKYFITVTEDINELKNAEKEKEILQNQLFQSQKMEAIGLLTGGIAHDFNNLLQAINGYTQILLMDKDEHDPEYPNLEAIYNAGKRAATLVRQLLLFSRKADTERRPVVLNREIEQVIKMLERTIPKMVDIEVRLESGLWAIHADPLQMEQILLNLGSNAADAMPDEGRLVIETQNVTLGKDFTDIHLEAQPGRYVLLTVSDTGHGMDPDTLGKIFEPFFTTKEIGQGTGLGLASVYGIVKNHDGYILCRSEAGQGTTFEIYLPALEQPRTEETDETLCEPPKGGTETILLVDDEESIRGLASQTFKRFGYTYLSASSGEEALEIYSENSDEIDLVIMDIGMPGMGGHKCLQEIFQIDPAAKVIIASGYAKNGQVRKSLETGVVGYVGKPYQLNDLLKKVRSVLDGEPADWPTG